MKLFWDIVAWVMIGSFFFAVLGCGYVVSLDLLNLRHKVSAKVDNIIVKIFGVSYGIGAISVALMIIWAVFFKK